MFTEIKMGIGKTEADKILYLSLDCCKLTAKRKILLIISLASCKLENLEASTLLEKSSFWIQTHPKRICASYPTNMNKGQEHFSIIEKLLSLTLFAWDAHLQS